MAVAGPIVQNASQAVAASRAVLSEAFILKVGQVLDAVVVGETSNGMATLKIGDQIVTAKLPQLDLPVGSTLQLQVKSTGSAPQLQVMNRVSPEPVSAKAAVLLPSPPLPPAGLARAVSVEPAAVHGQTAVPSQPLVGSPAPAGQQYSESAQGAGAPGSQSESKTASAVPAASSSPRATVDEPLPRPAAAVTATPGPGPAPAVREVGLAPTVSPSVTPSPQPAPQAPPVGAAHDVASQALPTQPLVPAGEGRATVVASPAVTVAATPSEDAKPASSPVVPSLAAAKAEIPTSSAPAPRPQVQLSAPAAEPAAPNPLLLAQSAPRPHASVADLPRMTVVPTPAAAGPVPQPIPSVPATPQAALTQMLPEALGRQDSAGPLLASLAAAVQKQGVLPEPVLRAALGVLAQRVIVSDGKIQASQIQQAIVRSGVTLEAALLQGAPRPNDAKAGLLALREALGKWLGGTPAPIPGGRDAAPPPIKGLPLRAAPIDPPPLPDAPRDVGRLLHAETDAGVSRLKLMQLASLPDSDPGKPSAPSLRMELPFLIGHELVMAQMQVGRDAPRREQDRKRGWTMRFALNFSQTGEVGAEVGVLGKAVNVALWAAEAQTAAVMEETLPELTRSLEAVGLRPGVIRIRHGVPVEPQRPVAGQLLDSVS